MSSKVYFDEKKVKEIYSSMTTLRANHPLNVEIELAINRQMEIHRIVNQKNGQKIFLPELMLKSSANHSVLLKSRYGEKLTLVDVWASWCVPCRAKHPQYFDFYRKFKGKGFEIISLSLDKDDKKWQRAVIDDKMIWQNFLVPDNFNNPFVKELKIVGIPANFLVNDKNEVVAKNLNLEGLEAFLFSYFKLNKGE